MAMRAAAGPPRARFAARAHVLVRFKDDPALAHHRVILAVDPAAPHRVVWAALDRDIWIVKLEREPGGQFVEIERWAGPGARLPSGWRKRESYLAEHSSLGNFTPAEVELLVKSGEALLRPPVAGPPNRRLTGKQPPPAPVAGQAPAPAGSVPPVLPLSSGGQSRGGGGGSAAAAADVGDRS